jgi:hypothetical protein
MRWIIGIVIVVVLAILGYQYFGARDMDVAEQAQEGAQQAGQQAEEATEATGQAAEETAEQAGDATQETAEEAATGAQQATEEAAEATEGAADQAQQTGEQAAEGAQQATEEAAEDTEETAEQPAAGAQQATEEAAEGTEETAEQAAGGAQQATEEAAGATEQAAEATQEAGEGTAAGAQETLTEAQTAALTVGDVNVGQQLTEIVGNTEESLKGVTDVASAEAAVPALNDINAQLEKLAAPVGQLPEDAKKVLADVLGDRVTELKTLADSVTSREGVGAVLTPVLEPIMAKLDSWAQQPA